MADFPTNLGPTHKPSVRDGAPELRRLDSASLMGKQQVIEILHRGQVYLLRETSTGKLILTK